jgi:hypothetical protein
MPGHTTSVQDTPVPSTPGAAQKPSRIDHELYFSSLALRLLAILCLGALASFSLASYFLTPPYLNITTSSWYTDGACTAQPQTIHYIHPLSSQERTTPVPSAWTKAGKNSQQFALAQACAAAFTITYETFSIAHPTSLTSAVSMLSSAGKKHFFVGTGTEAKERRLDATWQAQARKEHLQQSAQALKEAQLLTVLLRNGTFSAIFIMNYQLSTTISGKSTTQQKQLKVTLDAISVAPSEASTGWQVVGWSGV